VGLQYLPSALARVWQIGDAVVFSLQHFSKAMCVRILHSIKKLPALQRGAIAA
jgi:hypothetical protein